MWAERFSAPPLADACPTLVFVAHGGVLEPQAALLAASLHDAYVPAKVICRVMEPANHWGALRPDVANFLDQCGVEIRPLRNRIDDAYPHGNKIAALEGVSGRAVFLDTDMLLMVPFSTHQRLLGVAAAKPADVDTFSAGGGSWARVWSMFDRDVPAKIYTASISGETIRPYFNAGFVMASDGDALAGMWTEVAKRIDAEPSIVNKRPWLDQIALPVAFAELGWPVDDLTDAFNYPCHLADLGVMAPYFAHYHYTRVLAAQPKLAHRTRRLMAKYPALRAILKASGSDGWANLPDELANR
ncbi:MAG: hypothetical protein AAGF45_09370 [Pseudomonadota bacterium]